MKRTPCKSLRDPVPTSTAAQDWGRSNGGASALLLALSSSAAKLSGDADDCQPIGNVHVDLVCNTGTTLLSNEDQIQYHQYPS